MTLILAQYAASTSLERIPEEVRERAKQVILDELASAHFGRAQPAGALAAQYVAGLAGPPEARVLGTPLRVSAPLAALANGTAGHADEIDGAHVVGGHPGATLVHAAVAMAERQVATGAELLNAVVLGYDIGVRLIEACGGLFGVKERHHLNADFLHAVAAAVASGCGHWRSPVSATTGGRPRSPRPSSPITCGACRTPWRRRPSGRRPSSSCSPGICPPWRRCPIRAAARQAPCTSGTGAPPPAAARTP
ncbi:hypothetical protein AQJ11_37845 [Streptomyces corchorusii]|uniref:MmgE/PrpD N-terminal domain-containing protein n=2 Tax=Streptomyces TaxID=1883 RepID=A0A101PTZ4_STRCK|nr:hypothetical protein AQJ11_37845 [Streptomyces corchorusii]